MTLLTHHMCTTHRRLSVVVKCVYSYHLLHCAVKGRSHITGRTQFDYANPDARDRARSAWTEFPKTASQLAALAVLPHVHEPAPSHRPRPAQSAGQREAAEELVASYRARSSKRPTTGPWPSRRPSSSTGSTA